MVLHDTHAFFRTPRIELEARRIIAFSGALALNIAVLLLLLVPARMPPPMPLTDHDITVVPIIDPIVVPPIPPTVPISHQEPVVHPVRVSVPRDAVAPVSDQVIVAEGTLPAETDATPIADTTADIATPIGPVAGMRLEYAKAPAPPYPREALLGGQQGTVMLQVLVDVDGRPLQVDIRQSSGNRKLDDAARRWVLKRWTFRPAMQDGHAVQAIGIVPIEFNLGT